MKKEMAVNRCPSCKCVLANHLAAGGVCERCGSEVVRRVKSQRMLKITAYAQRLLDDLDELDLSTVSRYSSATGSVAPLARRLILPPQRAIR